MKRVLTHTRTHWCIVTILLLSQLASPFGQVLATGEILTSSGNTMVDTSASAPVDEPNDTEEIIIIPEIPEDAPPLNPIQTTGTSTTRSTSGATVQSGITLLTGGSVQSGTVMTSGIVISSGTTATDASRVNSGSEVTTESLTTSGAALNEVQLYEKLKEIEKQVKEEHETLCTRSAIGCQELIDEQSESIVITLIDESDIIIDPDSVKQTDNEGEKTPEIEFTIYEEEETEGLGLDAQAILASLFDDDAREDDALLDQEDETADEDTAQMKQLLIALYKAEFLLQDLFTDESSDEEKPSLLYRWEPLYSDYLPEIKNTLFTKDLVHLWHPRLQATARIPKETIITIAGDKIFGIEALGISPFAGVLPPLSVDTAFSFGLSGVHLQFDKPVEISVPVRAHNNAIVTVFVKHDGDTDFNTTGLSTDALTSCTDEGVATIPGNELTVEDGIITFYTCGASDFVVITNSPNNGTAAPSPTPTIDTYSGAASVALTLPESTTVITGYTATDATPLGEFGSITLTSNAFTNLNTQYEYCDPIFVASPRYESSSNAAATDATRERQPRFNNISGTGFALKVDNHAQNLIASLNTQVDYLIMERGSHTFDDGLGGELKLEAGRVDAVSDIYSDSCRGNRDGPDVTYAIAFDSPPVVVHTVSSYNDATDVTSQITGVGTRQSEPSTTDMNVALSVGMDTACVHDPEDIDYVAFDPGHISNGGFEMDFTRTADTIDCCNMAGNTVGYDTNFSTAPATILTAQIGMDGVNGGYSLVRSDFTPTSSQVQLSYDEHGDNTDRNHTAEIVSLVSLSSSSGVFIDNNPLLSRSLTGTDADDFTITTGGVLSFASALDYQAPTDADADNTYEVTVLVDDTSTSCSNQSSQDLTITIEEPNYSPTDILLSGSSINENNPTGGAIGTLSSVDLSTTDTRTYSLVAGAGDTDNGSFSISGDQLIIDVVTDFEVQSGYAVRIQTEDSQTNTYQEAFTVTINDLLEGVCGDGSIGLATTPFSVTESFENNNGTTSANSTIITTGSHTVSFSTTNNTRGRIRYGTNAVIANTGGGAATLDKTSNPGGNVDNFLTIQTDLSSYTSATDIALGFAFTHHGEEVDAPDIVEVRGSATDAWLQIYDRGANLPTAGTYTTVANLDIDALLTGNGQTVSATTQVRFGQGGKKPANSLTADDGLSLDDIVISRSDPNSITTEDCDDGNLIDGDGCSSTCTIEPGATCTGEPSSCTVCGNASIEGSETCDDGNLLDNDGCSSTCQIETGRFCTDLSATCGNGIVDQGEQCDDTNTTNGDGCSALCQNEYNFTTDGFTSHALSPENGATNGGGGHNGPATRTVGGGGYTVSDSNKSYPSVYLASGTAREMGLPASVSINLESTGDDDYVGFVLGFASGDFINPDADYLLVSWKETTQSVNYTDTFTSIPGGNGDAGVALSRIQGAVGWDELWQLQDYSGTTGSVTELARGTTYGTVGYTPPHTITVTYATGYIDIAIDGVTDISYTGLIPDGGLGLYVFSQEGVTYSLEKPNRFRQSVYECYEDCGDGLQVGSEQCDDNNTTDGDGCSSLCLIEPPNECLGEGGGNNCSPNATCTDTYEGFTCACNPPFTGNGITCTNGSNSDPTDIVLSGNTINEKNAIGDFVGFLTTADVNTGDVHTYTGCSIPAADQTYFTLSGDQVLAATGFDFEAPVDANTDNIYEFCVLTDDGNSGQYEEILFITVLDVLEQLCIMVGTGVNFPAIQTHNLPISYDVSQTLTGWFGVLDTFGSNTGWYTTVSISSFTGSNGTIMPATVASIRNINPLTVLSGSANPNIQIGPALGAYTQFDTPILYLERPIGQNNGIIGEYTTTPELRLSIPAYQAIDTYTAIIEYTLYEN